MVEFYARLIDDKGVVEKPFTVDAKIGTLIEQINRLDGVLETVTKDDVHIRSLRLAGDTVNMQFGRFRTKDLPILLAMTDGAPVMTGHRKDKLPIGRLFGGDIVERNGINFIRPNIFWSAKLEEGEKLRVNIDHGIYNEASINIFFNKPTCSICGEDIRNSEKCEHLPGKKYDDELCFFWYDEVKKVGEGSIVYRGSQEGTGFEKIDGGLAAALSEKADRINSQQIKQIKQIKKGEDMSDKIKLEFEPDVIKALAVTLGAEGELKDVDGLVKAAVDQQEKIATLQADNEALKDKAKFGGSVINGTRQKVKDLEVKIAALAGREPLPGFGTLIDKLDTEALSAITEQKEAELEQVAPALKCATCGSTDITRRVSAAEELNKTTQPVERQRNPAGVRI
jgi:hypothetical protein